MSPRLPRITGAEVIRALRQAGWSIQHHHGSHAYLRHPEHPGMRITVAVHAGTERPQMITIDVAA